MSDYNQLELELVAHHPEEEVYFTLHGRYDPTEYDRIHYALYGRLGNGLAEWVKDYDPGAEPSGVRLDALEEARERGLPLLDRSHHATVQYRIPETKDKVVIPPAIWCSMFYFVQGVATELRERGKAGPRNAKDRLEASLNVGEDGLVVELLDYARDWAYVGEAVFQSYGDSPGVFDYDLSNDAIPRIFVDLVVESNHQLPMREAFLLRAIEATHEYLRG